MNEQSVTHEAIHQSVGENAAEAPTQEEIIQTLRERVARQEAQLNKSDQHINSLDQALRISQARGLQLEANVTALRKQRDVFVEREADALVDNTLISDKKEETEKHHAQVLDRIEKEHQPLRAKLHQTASALTEIRDKFGDVKHDLKEAQRQRDTAHGQVLDAEAASGYWRAALAWYMNITAGLKYSVPYRFKREMGTPLNADHILAAFKEVENPDRSVKRMKVAKHNVPEFIVYAVRRQHKPSAE